MTFEKTKEEISEAIKECEDRLKCLREELNKPSYSGKRWKPKMGERYFYFTGCGEVYVNKWCGDNNDEKLYASGDVFPTQEAAEFEVERRKVIAELSDYAEGEDAVWDMVQCHYMLCYDYISDRVDWDYDQCFKRGSLYFSSREAAFAAVKAVGEERVKKYYLGVKE